jgi:hypothetical protein
MIVSLHVIHVVTNVYFHAAQLAHQQGPVVT